LGNGEPKASCELQVITACRNDDAVTLASFMHMSPRPEVMIRKSHDKARTIPPAKAGHVRVVVTFFEKRLGGLTMPIDSSDGDERESHEPVHDRVEDGFG
jgi:hypothetical protein